MNMFSSEEDFLEFLKKNHKSTNTIPKNWLGIRDDAAVIDINKTGLIICTDATHICFCSFYSFMGFCSYNSR